MIPKLFNWLFGKKLTSTLVGICLGAITGLSGPAMQGNFTKEALLSGAVVGGIAALSGAGGRAHGEK